MQVIPTQHHLPLGLPSTPCSRLSRTRHRRGLCLNHSCTQLAAGTSLHLHPASKAPRFHCPFRVLPSEKIFENIVSSIHKAKPCWAVQSDSPQLCMPCTRDGWASSRAGLCRSMCKRALGNETRRDKQINRSRQISSKIVISLLKLP